MYFCMSKVITNNKTSVSHGKGLTKDVAEYFASKDYFYNGYILLSNEKRGSLQQKSQ